MKQIVIIILCLILAAGIGVRLAQSATGVCVDGQCSTSPVSPVSPVYLPVVVR